MDSWSRRLRAAAVRLWRRARARRDAHTRSEQRFRGALLASLDALFILEPIRDGGGRVVDFVYREVNEAGCAMACLPPHLLIGARMTALFPTVARGDGFAGIVRVAETGLPVEDEILSTVVTQQTRTLQRQIVPVGGELLMTVRDVSERRHADLERGARERSEASGRHLKELAETIPQIVWTAQPDGWVDYFNTQWFEYSGLALDESLGWGWEQVVHPDDLDMAAWRWTHSFTTGDPFDVEYRFRRAADATYRWHLGRARPVRDEDGAIVKWFGTSTDIDDQKQAVEMIRRAATAEARHDGARRFREIVETVRLAALELDVTGRVTFVNDAMLVLTGYSRDELIGADWFDTCLVRGADERAMFEEGVVAGTLVPHNESEILTRSQAVRVVQWDNATHYDERGRVCGAASFGTDVTDRRAEEAALTLLLDVTRAVGEAPQLDDALALTLERFCATTGWCYGEVWLPLRDGVTLERRGVHVGREGLEPLSSPAGVVTMRLGEGLAGRAWAEQQSVWVPDFDGEASLPRRREAALAGVHAGAAIPVLDGDTVVAVLSFCLDHPRPSDERRLSLIAVVAHQLGALVARRRAEHEIVLARDAAEAASRAKSDFLARMSHELRTPLNSIIGFADLLMRSPAVAGRAQDAKMLERVRVNGRHLLGLINDVLDLAKVESGHLQIEQSLVRVDDMVREVAAGLAFRTLDRDVTLRCVVPDFVTPCYTDETRLRQVLLNLVGNALKFTEQGEVVLTVETDPWTSQPRRVLVRDTGIGIPPDRHEAVFEAFEQADVTVTRRFGGTGLGLPITRALCEALGFRLTLESSEGQGSTFVIALGEIQATRAA